MNEVSTSLQMLSPRLLRTSQVLVLISVDGEDRMFDLRLLAMKGITLGLIQREGNALDELLKQAGEDALQSRFNGATNRSYLAIYESRIGDDLRIKWTLKKADSCDSQVAMSSVLPE